MTKNKNTNKLFIHYTTFTETDMALMAKTFVICTQCVAIFYKIFELNCRGCQQNSSRIVAQCKYKRYEMRSSVISPPMGTFASL